MPYSYTFEHIFVFVAAELCLFFLHFRTYMCLSLPNGVLCSGAFGGISSASDRRICSLLGDSSKWMLLYWAMLCVHPLCLVSGSCNGTESTETRVDWPHNTCSSCSFFPVRGSRPFHLRLF